ncbi:MAG: phage virion morphogenesis protein [Urechidicola sp.]|nr:phage virion morphogenesis protein [Urechidicola sp.]
MSQFIAKLNKISRAVDRMPNRLAVVAVNFSKERFRNKNWVDRTRQPWVKRKRKDRGSLMVRTGRLKRSIRKIAVSRDRIIIGTDVPYAKAHNEGSTIKTNARVRGHKRRTRTGTSNVKEHTRKMNLTLPPRRFIGPSAVLMRRIERQVEREFKNALK